MIITESSSGKSSKGHKDFKKAEWFFKVHWKNDPYFWNVTDKT